jgi:hypothetical protein
LIAVLDSSFKIMQISADNLSANPRSFGLHVAFFILPFLYICGSPASEEAQHPHAACSFPQKPFILSPDFGF